MTLRGWNDVQLDTAYTLAEAAPLLRRDAVTLERWARAGKIATLPRPGGRGPYLVLGSTLLLMLGERKSELLPRGETEAERRRRSEAARADMRRLAKATR